MKTGQNRAKNSNPRSQRRFRASIAKNPIDPHRIRKISGSFAFIEHRFLRDGFWASLDHHQLLLYLFLIIVADRHGLSYYSYDKICTLLRIDVDDYILARNALIDKNLIAFDGSLFQVLSLPEKAALYSPAPLKDQKDMELHDPATIHNLILQSFGGDHG
ncbi:hypothetical protein [uncultured Desulfobacter sp.]|uniref:hypothetical protein n=1 Tax=uncultured Desulfobacter sp. TaxID=240139 RepID=UPI002AAB7298|nr:hypothetical protein [uncultured Desulfobacter sp.]